MQNFFNEEKITEYAFKAIVYDFSANSSTKWKCKNDLVSKIPSLSSSFHTIK